MLDRATLTLALYSLVDPFSAVTNTETLLFPVLKLVPPVVVTVATSEVASASI